MNPMFPESVSSSVAKKSPLHKNSAHESAIGHVTGRAIYVDDLPEPKGMLHAVAVVSPVGRGTIVSYDVEAAKRVKGVRGVFVAQDIPGTNDVSPFSHDEPLLAEGEVFCEGQHIALVVGESLQACRAGCKAFALEILEQEPILTIQQAIAAHSFLGTPHVMKRGNLKEAFAASDLILEGEITTGGQDHFYLESHVALVCPEENNTFHVYSSTQHPSEVQQKVAEILGISAHQVVVEVKRMGGGFGGKETQGAYFAGMAALAAHHLGKPVKMWLNRDQDMTQTGKRHPFYSRYKAGFDNAGNLLGIEVNIFSNGGWSSDLSGPILDRALFHLDNAYYLPNLRFEGRVCKTNTVSNTAFRGFGGPQGVVVIEEVLNRAAVRLGMDFAEIRMKNFYGEAPRNYTPYYQEVPQDRSLRIYKELLVSSDYSQRKEAIVRHNQNSRFIKHGIGYQPVNFGISFTNSLLNQAGALVVVYADGSVQLNHGGTEMGQGLYTKMLAICAHDLGVSLSQIRHMKTSTDKIPNTSATAASSGSDLNGGAVQDACFRLKRRLLPVACELLEAPLSEQEQIVFEDGWVFHAQEPSRSIPFSQVTMEAYFQKISLSATGFYKTPNIHYSREEGKGHPFHYYAYGAAVVEVAVHLLTGEHRLRRVDVLHDCGNSLVPSIDIGQIEGAFVQGLGWLTCEELIWDAKGRLRTHSPDTYKIPAYGEAPHDFRVHLLDKAEQSDVVHGSKAVGEPPFMLAIGVVTALRHALQGCHASEELHLSLPCTPESVLKAIHL